MSDTKNKKKSFRDRLMNIEFKGLGIWSGYFVFKIVLFFLGMINFCIHKNVALAVFLCIRFRGKWSVAANIIGLVLAVMLLYHDSYLPSIEQILAQKSNLEGFSFSYALNFLLDFVSLPILFGFVGCIAGAVLLKDFIRITTCVFTGFIAVAVYSYYGESSINQSDDALAKCEPNESGNLAKSNSSDIPNMNKTASSAVLEDYLTNFLEFEHSRRVSMPDKLNDGFEPFDIVVLNVCSLANDDLDAASMTSHPVFRSFDAKFDNFSGATSYSTPASLRFLRSQCGQETEAEMYRERRQECELLSSLNKLGFATGVYLDHNGEYGNYLSSLASYGGLTTRPENQQLLTIKYRSFDNSPIFSDRDLFEQYIKEITLKPNYGRASFFNLISLHDGNRKEGESRTMSFNARLKIFLDDLNFFMSKLEQSGHRTLLILLPEHGAAIRGDKMQIAKLREIPSTKITDIPVYVRFFGLPKSETMKKIGGYHSHMAIAELIKRAIEDNVYASGGKGYEEILSNLPETAPVSESTNAFFIKYGSSDWFKLKGENWQQYKK